MKKGKFGIRLDIVAVLAFCFAALLQPIPVLLIVGFSLLAEKDDWLNRQVLQALLLTVCYYLATLVTGWVFGGTTRFFGWVALFGVQNAVNVTNLIVDGIIQTVVIVFSVIAAVRILRGKDAGLPWLSKVASGEYSSARPQPAYPPTPYKTVGAASPVYSGQPKSEPVYVAYAATPPITPSETTPPVPDVKLCPTCSSPLQTGTRFCTQCGAKVE